MTSGTQDNPPVVRAEQIRRTYSHPRRPVEALRGVDLAIHPGRQVAVMGASGSGKSTLLHIVGGLDRPDGGTIVVDGQDLSQLSDRKLTLFRRHRVGMVFQFFNLVDTLTAAENVALPMAIDRAPRARIRARVAELLDLVGLADRGDHRPDAMSGGERQRVAIARALLMDPPLLLADEPTGTLDSHNARIIWELFSKLCRELGKTLLLVTHEAEVAAQADRILLLRDGQFIGAVEADEHKHDPQMVASWSAKLLR